MKLKAILFIATFGYLLFLPDYLKSQTFLDTDTLKIVPSLDTVTPGQSGVQVSVHLTNTVTIAGFTLRLVYNPFTFIPASPLYSKPPRSQQMNIFQGGSPSPGVITFIASRSVSSSGIISPGTGSVVDFFFDIDPLSFGGDYEIKLENDPDPPVYDNSMSDTSGTVLYIPILKSATVYIEGVLQEDKLPFSLKQNYPNPFNRQTNFEFFLFEDGEVVLEVFDIRGKKVKTLLKQGMTIGDHKTFWDAADFKGNPVPAGVYFYRLKLNGKTQAKKMLVIK
ncbi:MAG: hypothetical protein RBG1_1C00001G1416 [candidate division Zixibacteria bacterium RBG-1]|nr:MAG: hypothetical protein RBG1_1C00001G1416 [candidate division Zixibacteria bacterium RBG-1]OGC84513.1 MAG: hypothetical protein A2V73_01650 [candidate division Zixibacteria bacterium RBG_19FT_COMBO_42_43]